MKPVDGNRELSPGECRALLSAGGIGRVALSVGALPAIFPVHYHLYDDQIVLDPTIAPAQAWSFTDAVIAFEVDALDAAGDMGWSVLVVGRAERAVDTGVTRIPSHHISGYRFQLPDPFPPGH
jgi:nitroimidazol reductase NimA-like FMN-containing flavoprotein (pyridoxamine 5'-phosphate oxidase superfamily)